MAQARELSILLRSLQRTEMPKRAPWWLDIRACRTAGLAGVTERRQALQLRPGGGHNSRGSSLLPRRVSLVDIFAQSCSTMTHARTGLAKHMSRHPTARKCHAGVQTDTERTANACGWARSARVGPEELHMATRTLGARM